LPQAAEEVSKSLLCSKRQYRVAVAQIRTTPGRISENTERIIACIHAAKERGANLVVFPELTIPGYCSMDLLFNPNYVRDNLLALEKIRSATKGITAIVGFVDTDVSASRPGGRPVLYNSAAIIHDGVVVSVQDKDLLPNYEIFFEERYFQSARSRNVVEVGGIRLGTQICEDLWSDGYPANPTQELSRQLPDLIVNLSASPFHLGKLASRAALVGRAATEAQVPFVYANLIGSYDGFEGQLVFDGRSIVTGPSGEIKGLGAGFEEELLLVDVFGPQKMVLPEVDEVAELHDALVLGIKDYFCREGRLSQKKFEKAIIGVSGGIDSALVAALAVEALGSENVLGITLPSQYNSSATISDAELLARNLGIQLITSPIQSQVDACLDTYRSQSAIASLPEDVSEENVQARLRMLGLMFFANKLRGLVLNTGNKTELALDNCTIYGDMVGGFSVLGDVDKDRVFALSHYINRRAGTALIPLSTIERPPSAELKPGQTDDQVMGAPPHLIAPMVREIIEQSLPFPEALKRFEGTFSHKVIEGVYQKLDRSEWKRRQAAPAIRVTPHAFGNGRRVPMNHGYLG
jgi:NAD+ synthetase